MEIANLSHSRKVLGKYEEPIMDALSTHFNRLGFTVATHVRINIPWSTSISDIDMIMMDQDRNIIVVEINSKKDNLKRAQKQLEELFSYGIVDFAYVATDYMPRKFELAATHGVGLLVVDTNSQLVDIVVKAKQRPPKFGSRSFSGMYNICLTRLQNINYQTNRFYMALDLQRAWDKGERKITRDLLQDIFFCKHDCEGDCPIWKVFPKRDYRAASKPLRPDDAQQRSMDAFHDD